MDFQKKLFAYLLLFTSAFLLWSTWQQEQTPPAVAAQQAVVQAMPAASSLVPDAPQAPVTQQQVAPVPFAPATTNLITVKTDVMSLAISPVDGNIVNSSLSNYPLSLDNKEPIAFETMSSMWRVRRDLNPRSSP